MNLVTQYRREPFLKHVNPATGMGLEIGPHNQPMVTKDEGHILYMDYLTREEHIRKNPNAGYIDDIPETDIVIEDNDYAKYVNDKFDYIIANHVIEHAPDLIGFLMSLYSMLRDDGVLFLAIPDKKFTFDRFRPNTTLAHVIADYLNGPEASLRQHMIEVHLLYDMTFIGRPQNLSERLTKQSITEYFKTTPHYGLHCHVFQSETVLQILIKPLLASGFVQLDLIEFVPARAERGGEMTLMLRKGQFTGDVAEDEFFNLQNSNPGLHGTT